MRGSGMACFGGFGLSEAAYARNPQYLVIGEALRAVNAALSPATGGNTP